jgi:hypothetical protein
MRVEGLLALRTGHLYPQKVSLVLISVKRLSPLQGHSAAGRIMSMKNLSASTNCIISYPKPWVILIFIGLQTVLPPTYLSHLIMTRRYSHGP